MGNKQTGNINQSSTPSNSDLSCEALSKKLSKTGNMNQLNRSINSFTNPQTLNDMRDRIATFRKDTIRYYKTLSKIIDPTKNVSNEDISREKLVIDLTHLSPEKHAEAEKKIKILNGMIDQLNTLKNNLAIMDNIKFYAEQYREKRCVKGKDHRNKNTKGGRKTRRILRT